MDNENCLPRFCLFEAIIGHAPADHTNRRTDREGYAAWENSSVFARILRKLIPSPKRMELNLWTRRSKGLKAALEAIRDIAANALNQVGHSQGERSMRWKCKACQYVKHFTKPVPLEAAADTPDARARSSDLFCETS
jgi:hypothetical protein